MVIGKKRAETTRHRGTIQSLGLEGGLWALITDEGRTMELLDPPAELLEAGLRVEIEGELDAAEVTIGMLGDTLRVRSFEALE
ncbi:MAG: hypothetical protein OEY14_02120 [Myxococcales bacterium]|nr:hypothetical protein [Myxococcales bacterium]